MKKFDYENAFSRNLGFVSHEDQIKISETRIAIPGMGGVGGHHLHTLARLGFKHFHIADFDHFEIHNFNRQIGSKISSLGRPKVEVMEKMFLDIIPDGTVKIFNKGVNKENYEEFLEDIDYLVDGLDVYVIKERIELFERARLKGITSITAAPLGMGTSIISFSPNEMSFKNYFDFNTESAQEEMLVKFLAGINPKPTFLKYLLYDELIDMHAGRAPSLHLGVLAATTAMGAEVFNLVLNRKKMKFAPHSTQYDFFFNRAIKTWTPFGNRNWRQKILIYFIRKKLQKN